MNEAREGQVAVEMACGCDQTTLVREYMVDGWQCGGCRTKPTPTGRRVTLGWRGALPADWREQQVAAA